MSTIYCIVEGHGEVAATPILLQRIGETLDPPVYPKIPHPIRIPATKLRKKNELERAVKLAALKSGNHGAILILLDCDDGCPAEEGPALLRRAKAARPDRKIAVVMAKKEYEAWFLAAAESLRGKRGLPDDLTPPPDPEAIRDAKGWLTKRMAKNASYSATTDQPALTSIFDLQEARNADSFDKCYREIVKILKAVSP